MFTVDVCNWNPKVTRFLTLSARCEIHSKTNYRFTVTVAVNSLKNDQAYTCNSKYSFAFDTAPYRRSKAIDRLVRGGGRGYVFLFLIFDEIFFVFKFKLKLFKFHF